MTTPKTQFPIAAPESYAPPAVRETVPARREARLPSSAHVGLLFLLLTIVGFVALGAALPNYTLSSTARRGLTYDTLFAELHDALVDEPDRPLRRAIRAVQVDALIPAPNGYSIVTFDTLAADPSVYPSLEPGGFLHDEIDRFNTFQRERLDAVRRGRLTGGAVMDLRAAENPSIFRTEIRAIDDMRGERDSIVLADRAVPYGLRVPSPFDAARLVAVTTREWSRSLGWISARGAQSVRASGRVPGVPACPFRAVKDSVYVECTAPGSPFNQLVLRFPDRLGETGTATLFTSERTLYDGRQLPSRRTVTIGTGGMFQFHSRALAPGRTRPEPVILEWTLGGTLGGTQWINGRIRWQPSVARTSPFVRQLASAAGFGASVELEGGRNIPLSLDEALTDDLQDELDDFVGKGKRGGSGAHLQASDLAFATIVLASAKTGEILGVAEYGPPAAGGGSWLLKPVNVGSAIKPLLAAAALTQRPELATLEVRNDAMSMDDVWGLPLGKPFEAGLSCPLGWIGLRQFLSCSSNRYSATLVAAALQPAGGRGLPELESAPGVTFRLGGETHVDRRLHLPLDRNHQIRADTLNGSVLAAGLFALDSLNTSLELAAQLGREGRDSSVWMHLRDDRFNPVRVPLGLWPEQSRLAMMRGSRPATARQLAMFSVGAAENRVTTLDLTQVFARLVTDRRVGLSFVPVEGHASFPPLELSKYSWYPAFVGGLHDVGTVGTAKGTQTAIAQQLSPSLVFYGKSGTLNAPPHVRTVRRTDTTMVNGAPVVRHLTFSDTVVPPVVAKTLLFAVGARYQRVAKTDSGRRGQAGDVKGQGQELGNSKESRGVIDCGVVGTIYFRLRRNPPHVESLATDFANERLWRLLRKNWQRLKVC